MPGKKIVIGSGPTLIVDRNEARNVLWLKNMDAVNDITINDIPNFVYGYVLKANLFLDLKILKANGEQPQNAWYGLGPGNPSLVYYESFEILPPITIPPKPDIQEPIKEKKDPVM